MPSEEQGAVVLPESGQPVLPPVAPSRFEASRAGVLRTWREDRLALFFFAFACLTGFAFRLGAPGLIEYKGDEAWMFRTTMWIVHGGKWPPVGMSSSVGLANPGLSLWIFPILARLTGATTPVELARAVQLMNCTALLLVFLFGWSRPKGTRAVWLWTAALAAVDPIAIILQRKIWAQSTLPLIVWLAFLGWHARSRLGGAFAWGLFGALVGQIHMTGFLYVPVFVLWAIWSQFRRRDRVRTRWIAWFAGSAVGAVPLVPWVLFVLRGGPGARVVAESIHRPLYWRIWIEDAIGWNVDYSLGPAHTNRFIKTPLLDGRWTWIAGGCLALIAAIAAVLLLSALWRLARRPREIFERLRREDAVAHNLAFVAYGLVITATRINLFRHYLLIAYPFEAMTVPLLAALGGRRAGWLLPVWVAHAVVVVLLEQYLMSNFGAPGGDFGRAFQFQGRLF